MKDLTVVELLRSAGETWEMTGGIRSYVLNVRVVERWRFCRFGQTDVFSDWQRDRQINRQTPHQTDRQTSWYSARYQSVYIRLCNADLSIRPAIRNKRIFLLHLTINKRCYRSEFLHRQRRVNVFCVNIDKLRNGIWCKYTLSGFPENITLIFMIWVYNI